MKNNKGITLIALIITVIVLAILTTVIVTRSTSMTQTARFETIETYMLSIKAKCKVISEKVYIGEMDSRELYGTEATFRGETGWYKLSQQDLNDIGVKDAKADEGYYVNYKLNEGEEGEDVDVAYEQGITLYGNTDYTLSSLLAERD